MDAKIKTWIEHVTGFSNENVFKAKSKKTVTSGFITFEQSLKISIGPPSVEKSKTGDQEFVRVTTTEPKEIRVLVDVYAPNGLDLLDALSASMASQTVIDIFTPDDLVRYEGSTDLGEIESNKYPDRFQGVFIISTETTREELIDQINYIELAGKIGNVDTTIKSGVPNE